MGLLPDFTEDVEYEMPIEAEKHYVLQPEFGFCALPDDVPNSYTRKGLPGSELLALAQGEFTPMSKRVAKVLCRDLLKPLIGDKPLKSRELFVVRKH